VGISAPVEQGRGEPVEVAGHQVRVSGPLDHEQQVPNPGGGNGFSQALPAGLC
jgi:hypothetical protein